MQTQTLNILADEQGKLLPNSLYPMTGLDVVFQVRGEKQLRRGRTSFIGGLDDSMKSMTVFLDKDYKESQMFYQLENVTHWKEQELAHPC
jgi:hypothetical protein